MQKRNSFQTVKIDHIFSLGGAYRRIKLILKHKSMYATDPREVVPKEFKTLATYFRTNVT